MTTQQLDKINERIKAAIITLRLMAKGEGIDLRTHGLCINLDRAIQSGSDVPHYVWKAVDTLLDEAFCAWPEFGGYVVYPIDGGRARYEATVDKWEGEYGEARMRLAGFCADYFEAYLKRN